MVTQIQIKQTVNGVITTAGYLDVKENISVPLNFSIAEIQDISKKNGAYSKTIVLPGSDNNNKLLNYLFDVNIVTSSFQQSKKADCVILQGGIPVFEGVMQLLDINKLSPALANGDQNIEYNIQITNDNSDFFSIISDSLLQDLSFSGFNHDYTWDNVLTTSGNTWIDVYKYNMMDNLGKSYYTLTDFTPSIFAKAYWDRIFSNAGYSYKWDSLVQDSFDKLIIPYNGEQPKSNEDTYTVTAGYSGSTGQTLQQIWFTGGFTTSGPVNQCYEYIGTQVIAPLIFNQEDNNPLNSYDSTTGIWRSPLHYSEVNFNIVYDYVIYLYADVDMYLDTSTINKDEFQFKVIHNLAKNTTFNIVGQQTIIEETLDANDLVLTAGYNAIYVSKAFINGLKLTDVKTNDNFFNWITGEYKTINQTPAFCTNLGWKDSSTNVFTNPPKMYIALGVSDTNNRSINSIKILPNPNLTEGQEVEINNFVPKNIKQKDFVASIIKMYNLYVEPDKVNNKKLIFQTRDDYYAGGSIKDWTNKLDINKDINLKFLPDLQNKKLLLTYKQDSDYYNKTYLESTGDIYGQYEYEFDNDFVKDTKKIELIFSPTPINENYFGDVIPMINTTVPKNNIRLLYDADWIDSRGWIYAPLNEVGPLLSGITSGVTYYNSYPYAGHFDNPLAPTIDINFGLVDYLFYDSWEGNQLTNNNLYNRYYKNFISQIENGKLLTGYFLINELDIQQLSFKDKIFIHDNYYYINKIIDYDANTNKLTKVELLSIDDYQQFTPTLEDVNRTGSVYGRLSNDNSINNVSNGNIIGNNVSVSTIRGFNNVLQPRTTGANIIGDNNNVAGKNSFIQGNNNQSFGDNNFRIGNNSTIIGSNITVIGGTVTGSIYTGSSAIYLQSPVYIGTNQSDSISISQIISGSTLWVPGSAGLSSIRARNLSNVDAIGDYAMATGLDNLASGIASNAEGTGTTASGNYSSASGDGTIASGVGSHAEGLVTIASGFYSHAEGLECIATGQTAHAEGNRTIASGQAAHAEGNDTIATGIYSHAEGTSTLASGLGSHSEGLNTVASGNFAHAEGINTTASGDYSHSEGTDTIATAEYTHAEGFASEANGTASHSEGFGTQANGDYSHSEGFASIANGQSSHAGGVSCTATGSNSFIHSNNSVVTGANSVLLGGNNLSGATANTVYTSYLAPLITEYLNDAAADADTTLSSGGLYKLTGSRTVYQKP